MKIRLLFTALLITCFISTNAQEIPLEKASIEFDYADRDCWQVEIPGESNDVKRAWKNFVKEHFDVRLKGFGLFSNKDLLSAEETEISAVSSKLINFYTHFKGKKNPTMRVFASYSKEDSSFIDSKNDSSEFKQLKDKVVVKFINSYYPKFYKNRVDTTIDKIETLTKNIKRDKEKVIELEAQIKELKERTVNNEEKLVTSKEDLEVRRKKLATVKKSLEKL